jgi:hypothetical protein
MSEKQDLEREIQRLSEIIGTSESALKAKAMSGSDRAWLTKQLGLRRIRLSRLRAAARRATAIPAKSTVPLEVRTVELPEPTMQEQRRRRR